MPSATQYWPLIMKNLENQISSSSYQTWFKSLDIVGIQNHGSKIVLKVPSLFNRDYIEKKYHKSLQEAINKYYPRVLHIDFEIDQSLIKSNQENLVQEEILGDSSLTQEIEEADKLKKISEFLPQRNLTNLNPKYTLKNFVVNSSNELAVSVTRSILKNPGMRYNPVFIYSQTGMGKTHLLQAIGQEMLREQPGFKVKYVTSEQFFNNFITSVIKNQGQDFRDHYRDVDLLLIDDIQFIQAKNSTQEAFFHTFNELHQLNKQIVITSDRSPKELEGLQDRLVSRFDWGITIDISNPSLEDRVSLLEFKIKDLNLQLKPQQIIKIAQKIKTNIRDLEGVINRIQAKIALLPNQQITDIELDRILGLSGQAGLINIHFKSQSLFNSDNVIKQAAKIFAITEKDLTGRSRIKDIALARQIAMYICKTALQMSLPMIARQFGNRDHTTVLHACKKIEKFKDSELVRTRIQAILKALQSN